MKDTVKVRCVVCHLECGVDDARKATILGQDVYFCPTDTQSMRQSALDIYAALLSGTGIQHKHIQKAVDIGRAVMHLAKAIR